MGAGAARGCVLDPGELQPAVADGKIDPIVSLFALAGRGPAGGIEHVVLKILDGPLTAAQSGPTRPHLKTRARRRHLISKVDGAPFPSARTSIRRPSIVRPRVVLRRRARGRGRPRGLGRGRLRGRALAALCLGHLVRAGEHRFVTARNQRRGQTDAGGELGARPGQGPAVLAEAVFSRYAQGGDVVEIERVEKVAARLWPTRTTSARSRRSTSVTAWSIASVSRSPGAIAAVGEAGEGHGDGRITGLTQPPGDRLQAQLPARLRGRALT